MRIGNKIRQLRQRAGLTQEQLAGTLGVSAQSVSKWENAVSMPDITLLPLIAEQFGVSVDELFDLTSEEKLRRIENRLERQRELPRDVFSEYEAFLLGELSKQESAREEPYRVLSLLAQLYHHRMETDAGRVTHYAKRAILLRPEKKDCQWLLNMAAGQRVWDWNFANHAELIDFYKQVIEQDCKEPKTPLPYYYLIDNLLSDHRTEEAKIYLNAVVTLPSHNPILIPIYRAHIARLEHDEEGAERIIREGLVRYAEDGDFLFEVAQYYAGKAEYEQAITFYERSWKQKEGRKPRFTDALDGIATIYSILKDREKIVATYDRMLQALKEEWGFSEDDRPVLEVEAKKRRWMSK